MRRAVEYSKAYSRYTTTGGQVSSLLTLHTRIFRYLGRKRRHYFHGESAKE
jgi:hypothetical protein